ncbi:hypothetical protein EON65_48950, partial [archaeon]
QISKTDGYVVQLYLHHPLLVDGRKFDIRCFVLMTVMEGKRGGGGRKGSKGAKQLQAYFFNTAYIRTSSKRYDMNKLEDRATHLTNDAVQKHAKDYGTYEQGKTSYIYFCLPCMWYTYLSNLTMCLCRQQVITNRVARVHQQGAPHCWQRYRDDKHLSCD